MRLLITYTLLLLLSSCVKQSAESSDVPVSNEPIIHTVIDQSDAHSEDKEEKELWIIVEVMDKPELPGEIPDFSGEFTHPGGDGGYHFSASLTQQSDSIFGSYCGGTTNRVDCGMESQGAPDCQVRGIIR